VRDEAVGAALPFCTRESVGCALWHEMGKQNVP
jgi:hypothetical protein